MTHHLYMYSGFYRKPGQTIFLLVFLLWAAVPAWGETGVKIVVSGDTWPEFTRIIPGAMVPFEEGFETIDDNFREDGVTGFTGIRISRLMELGGGSGKDQGLTIIGADQYVGYLPAEKLNRGFLVWEMNKRPIIGLKGGPLKVIFPEDAGIHPSCYTWYVSAMVAGTGRGARLSVTHQDKVSQFGRSELAAHAVSLDRSMFSVAQGCRNEFKDLPGQKEIKAVPLSWFLSAIPDARVKKYSVRLVPFAGPEVTLSPEILNYPVFVIVSCDNRVLHPALGGPFSVVFPLETHPELRGVVPESGALFFLEKIDIRDN